MLSVTILAASGRTDVWGAARRRRKTRIVAASSESKRTPKDPSAYASIEEIRRELEVSREMVPFSLTKAIQWVGDSINAGGSRSLAFRAYSWVLGLDQPLSWSRGST